MIIYHPDEVDGLLYNGKRVDTLDRKELLNLVRGLLCTPRYFALVDRPSVKVHPSVEIDMTCNRCAGVGCPYCSREAVPPPSSMRGKTPHTMVIDEPLQEAFDPDEWAAQYEQRPAPVLPPGAYKQGDTVRMDGVQRQTVTLEDIEKKVDDISKLLNIRSVVDAPCVTCNGLGIVATDQKDQEGEAVEMRCPDCGGCGIVATEE